MSSMQFDGKIVRNNKSFVSLKRASKKKTILWINAQSNNYCDGGSRERAIIFTGNCSSLSPFKKESRPTFKNPDFYLLTLKKKKKKKEKNCTKFFLFKLLEGRKKNTRYFSTLAAPTACIAAISISCAAVHKRNALFLGG